MTDGPISDNAIAIVGMAGRFPGAPNLELFWQHLRDGVESIVAFSDEELAALRVPEAARAAPNFVKAGAILRDVDQFAASFFGYTPREAELMDPQQRVFLECAWEALEQAGYRPKTFDGLIGVFAGTSLSTYLLFNLLTNPDIAQAEDTFPAMVSNDKDFLSTRVSYNLNLKGPSLDVQTGCSTSLVATHLACDSLLSYQCDLALAGGVSINVPQRTGYFYQQGGILSPDGHCRAFDADASGTIFGSGAGVVVLKRLQEALHDGDTIHAVIRSSAINNDGAVKVGYTAPSVEGQAEVLARAYALADVDLESIGYIETHGTGTRLGDPIEVTALTQVFRASTERRGFCALGSVKTNIGHLDAAAGVAGLIKTVLALKHHQLPPSLNVQTPNPEIDWEHSPFYVNDRLRAWPNDGRPRRAGVSSFGIGGTNAHIVLEEAPVSSSDDATRPHQLLLLSATSASALEQMTDNLAEHLRQHPTLNLADVAYTLQLGRQHFSHRRSLVCHDRLDALDALETARAERCATSQTEIEQRPVVFMFPGQGTQYPDMGLELYRHEPIFHAEVDRCCALLEPALGFDLRTVLYPPAEQREDARQQLDQTALAQPALFTIEYALAQLWISWGVEPQAMLGHSIGEYVAATLAGVMRLEDALRLVATRGQMMQQLPGGAMLAVLLPEAEVVAQLDPQLSLAAVNGAAECVVSGPTPLVEALHDRLVAHDVSCRYLHTSHAFHSAMIEPIVERFAAVVSQIALQPPSIPYLSNRSGTWITADEATDPRAWADHLRQAVRFADELHVLLHDPTPVLLEVGPGRTLGNLIRQHPAKQVGQPVLASLRHSRVTAHDTTVLLQTLAQLWHSGVAIDWAALYRAERRQRVPLPTYPFERQRYWIEPGSGGRHPLIGWSGAASAAGAHPLLGAAITSTSPITIFESQISADAPAYLRDHHILGSVMLPATGYIEMALAAAESVAGHSATLEQVTIGEALVLEQAPHTVQLAVQQVAASQFSFTIYSKPSAVVEQGGAWTLHASGQIRPAYGTPTPRGLPDSLETIRARCHESISAADFYSLMVERGIAFGPAFQGIQQVWRRDGEALAQIELPATLDDDAYQLHPALLDACVQLLAAALPSALLNGGSTFLPSGCARISVAAALPTRVISHVRLRSAIEQHADMIVGDIRVLDQDGQLVAELLGWRLRRVSRPRVTQAASSQDDWLYTISWQPQPCPDEAQPEQPSSWLILADRGGVGRRLAQQLEAHNQRCLLVHASGQPDDSATLMIDPADPAALHQLINSRLRDTEPPLRGVVHLWSLDVDDTAAPDAATIAAGQTLGCTSALHTVQSLLSADSPETPRLWLITRAAQRVTAAGPIALAQAPLWGLGKVIALEHPELRCVRVDLEPATADESSALLLAELWSQDHEDQVAFRDGTRYVPRLLPYADSARPAPAVERRLELPPAMAFGLAVPTPGSLDGLQLLPISPVAPGPGQVAIRVHAAGLNFVDLLKTMNLYPGLGDEPIFLGTECAGTIVAVGPGVEGLSVGDAVVALAPASVSTLVTTMAYLVAPKPAQLSFAAAATIPLAFMTAYYALHHLAGLCQGERVLIHSAAGGVGLAAIQVARWLGAQPLATVGNAEKRAFLESLGVEQIMDSRTLSFADEVLELTDGQGVDVVLNSLSGEALSRSMALLRPFGRFLDISKTDIYNNSRLDLYPFRNVLSYFAIDLERIFRERPALAQSLLHDVLERFASGDFQPLPLESYPIQAATQPFLALAQRKNIGKLAITLPDDLAEAAALIRADGSYLITGGLGGLGLRVAGWLVQQGARHVVLIGRRGPDAAAQEAIAALEAQGAQVLVAQADVADAAQLARVLDTVRAELPPLRGVLHAAGVLDDGPLLQLDQRRFARVTAPKISGGWHLHRLTLEQPLDFFVLFSSASAVFGASGQGNYAAANTFLEALGDYRRTQGLPSLCVSWGPWAEVGMAARAYRQDKRLAQQEVAMIAPQQGLAILQRLLHERIAAVTVLPYQPRELLQFAPQAASIPMFATIVGAAPGSASAPSAGARHPRPMLASEYVAPRDEIERRVAAIWQQVIGIEPIGVNDNFFELGGNSLLGIQVVSLLNKAFQTHIPAASLFEGGTVAFLARALQPEQDEQSYDERRSRGSQRRARRQRSYSAQGSGENG